MTKARRGVVQHGEVERGDGVSRRWATIRITEEPDPTIKVIREFDNDTEASAFCSQYAKEKGISEFDNDVDVY